jgi:hypothetical protein
MWIENRDVPFSTRVEQIRMSKDRTQLVVNPSLTLGGIPSEAFDYRLGSRSAPEWVLDQYRISTDKRSGIVTDPNRDDEPEYIVRLIGRVSTVSLQTARLVQREASRPVIWRVLICAIIGSLAAVDWRPEWTYPVGPEWRQSHRNSER